MKFLCGRPGCGKESTATLQIDAPSSTVSLVDPRISRDGVPLCARHADATTPPMGWAMNDLRSRGRPLSAVPDEDAAITSTPPRVRPENEIEAETEREDGRETDRHGGKKMSRRQSIAERARKREQTNPDEVATGADEAEADHRFGDSRSGIAADASEAPTGKKRSGPDEPDDGPSSRPKRRREVAAEEEPEEDRFPWHHQFDDDEPEELQASSPLLSRAFRATIG